MMPQVAIFLIILLVSPTFSAHGFLGGDLPLSNNINDKNSLITKSGIVEVSPQIHDTIPKVKRYLVFGNGNEDVSQFSPNSIYSINSERGFFFVGLFSDEIIPKLQIRGYYVIEDFHVDFHSNPIQDGSKVASIINSESVHEKYGYTGKGVNIAIVDTGVDFSNPDVEHSLARDKNNQPIMLDADGQGIILTNATFVANINDDRIIRNYSKTLPDFATSSVYKTRDGVFLDVKQGGKGTVIQIYNSFFPHQGPAPIFNGTLNDDMKIGKNSREFIDSKSGIYHLGVMYQGALEGPLTRLQVVPVLVVDANKAGVYDTIIPDLSTSWEDYIRFELPRGQKPNYDFDFTDEKPITLGSGNEILRYDFDKDGKFDYSAGTIGATVVDVYGAITKTKSQLDKTLKAINGTALPPLDPNGQFFGVMTDFMGHGTSSAASITSKGIQQYDIYNNTKKFSIKGVAPDAKIIPVKALWFGDSVYAWLWAAGFDNKNNKWEFQGNPRADIVSNSWGVSNFPLMQYAPGMDLLSLILNTLTVPKSIDENYPGVLMVSSAGNSGHGYGTIGLPNAAPFGLAVGATTNNVFVGYGPFKDQPRFGNTTDHASNIVDFSSRGPGLIGDPKPDIMSIGAHGFTPSAVTKLKKDSKQEAFSLYGGTSMAAPLVSGSAAIVIEGLKDNSQQADPFRIKNILMSTATDLQNDPYTQGSGLVNVGNAIEFVKGEDGKFIVYNDATYSNVKKILDRPLSLINSTSFGLGKFEIPSKTMYTSNWFGGQLLHGERSTAKFTIENPTNTTLKMQITPKYFELIKSDKFSGKTITHTQDPNLQKPNTFSPNYIQLTDVKQYEDLASYYRDKPYIPDDASLLVLNANFNFNQFMNFTDDIYANDLRIASLYLYDWSDNNNDTKVSSDELSMVNRAGSWGTSQEMRVSEPSSKFTDIPLVGVYPVPTRYSYWLGDTRQNSTSMEYDLSANYYKKNFWSAIWLDNNFIEVPPESKSHVYATIFVPTEYQTGTYQGFLEFTSNSHTVNVPVSFAVIQKIPEKDSLVLISGQETDDVLYGSGYTKGAFDMVNRYMAGDWRQFYFEIDDPAINTAAIELSWKNPDTNLSVFAIDPKGRIVQSNVPSGVFGHFMSWASNDWLGPSPFSQGGGFFPVKNKDDTSTVLYLPINQTATYSLMTHTTLFGGNSTTEPITIAAKFTNISPNQ